MVGTRRLNGPQTTGRDFRNLSEPAHEIVEDLDLAAPMRDGVNLMVDVLRPDSPDRFPALIAASPYPRQIQNLGLPLGFVEAGASDFFVPRGYAHVLANERGTGGSGGTYGMCDVQWRQDMHDLVEWAAAQPWCDGNVGMVGISAFAMAQVAAAVERPPHLKAIFPVAVTVDLYEAIWHGGLLSSTFIGAWLSGVANLAGTSGKIFRGRLGEVVQRVMRSSPVHTRLEHFNGEAALNVLGKVMPSKYPPHPWGDLYLAAAVEHQTRDEFWEERNMAPLMKQIEVPVYLGCDWDNVPLHLPSTFLALESLPEGLPVRVALMDKGLIWPWESLHVEALAWFDQWLKGRETGVMDGPRIRYQLGGEWHESDNWPPPGVEQEPWALRANGTLAPDEGEPGERSYVYLPPTLGRSKKARPTEDPSSLTWDSDPLETTLDVAGPVELALESTITGSDTAWIATLQDVGPDGSAEDVTAGWLRAGLGDRIRLVDTGHRFRAGHRIRLVLASEDGNGKPAMMGFQHAPLGIASRNTVRSASRLVLPRL
jgi:uncharacterized protein